MSLWKSAELSVHTHNIYYMCVCVLKVGIKANEIPNAAFFFFLSFFFLSKIKKHPIFIAGILYACSWQFLCDPLFS